jgi:hypothetical protein
LPHQSRWYSYFYIQETVPGVGSWWRWGAKDRVGRDPMHALARVRQVPVDSRSPGDDNAKIVEDDDTVSTQRWG